MTTGDAGVVSGSGVVDDAVRAVVLVGTRYALAGLVVQFSGRCKTSAFSILEASVSRLDCGDSETGGIFVSLPIWSGDKDAHSLEAGL